MKLIKFLIFITLFFNDFILPQGKVYLVIGSDTAIWDGMSVNNHQNNFKFGLFTDPLRNTYKVMDPNFRAQFRDSYNNPLRLTWWMLGGNMMREAVNNNIPVKNTMALHLMKKYHGNSIEVLGDELTLHYHTFKWTDYNQDGFFFWNQTKTFDELKDDFYITLAQFLLEENVFPVSFRSGWHYMDNGWQKELDKFIPYSLHNEWPYKNTDNTEPIDNNFDWSLAPSDFVPFNPSPENYQIPGNGKGWNVRSIAMQRLNQIVADSIFSKAAQGLDQVVCIWAHLPETDFLQNIEKVDSLIHKSAALFPQVTFEYTGAVDAMKKWRGSSDSIPPNITIQEEVSGSEVKFIVQTDEVLFQEYPFVAVKDIYENYYTPESEYIGNNRWKTVSSFKRNKIAKVGYAVTDTTGNLTTKIINYLPEEIFIDNSHPNYSELAGSWANNSSGNYWGTNFRKAVVPPGDSASFKYEFSVDSSLAYNIFIQAPQINNDLNRYTFLFRSGSDIDTIDFSASFAKNNWTYIGTYNLDTNENYTIEIAGKNSSGLPLNMAADVLKITPLVKDKELIVSPGFVNLGEISMNDTISISLSISNRGTEALNISNIYSLNASALIDVNLPLELGPMVETMVHVYFLAAERGIILDTLIIESDDPVAPLYLIPISAIAEEELIIIDNEDSANYNENGTWNYSVANAYGGTSRYAPISVIGAYAEFSAYIDIQGLYDVFDIIPQTVNSADKALYQIILNDEILDSFLVNQNQGSGGWKLHGRFFIPSQSEVKIKIINSGKSTAGDVIRADAVKLILAEHTTEINNENISPSEFMLFQNYPNPFNPATTIRFKLSEFGFVTLKIYDMLGREIANLVNEKLEAGDYEMEFNAQNLSSGVYFYSLTAGEFKSTKKLMLLK